jgi:integrase/recombinase XerD
MRMVEDRGASGSVAGLLGTSAEHDLVVASFSRFLGARGCSPNTLSAYLHDLKFLFAFLLSAGLTLEQLNVARSIDFMAYLTARARRVGGRHASRPAIVSDRLAPATINRVMAAVSTFYEHLLLTRALSFERNPLDGGGNEQRSTRRTNRRSMRLRRVLRVPRPMDNEQVSRLLGAATRLRDRTMLLLLLQGGIRVGELLNLHLEDVQYGRRRIAIRYRVDHPRGVRTKSRCERLVDLLEPEALASLSNYVATERPQDAPTQHVFLVGGRGRRRCEPLGYDAFVKLFRRLRRKAGLDEGWITPHALRHTHATLLWEGGMRELALQKRLGHASLEATRVYTRVSDAGMLADYRRALTALERRGS